MPMKDSKMTDAWIAKVVASNPFMMLPNGSIRSCPVRLQYPALLDPYKPRKDDKPDKKPTWGAAVMLPPGAEAGIQQIMYPEWVKACRAKHPKNFDAQGQPFGLHWPVHPCAEKQQLEGYTPGLYYFDASTTQKPPIVDSALNPIVDPSRVYSGVWAIICMNVYGYDNLKKGVSFGLQSVMIIADDTKLFKTGVDPNVAFEGVQIDHAFDPAGAFGPPPSGPAGFGPPAQSLLPAAQTVAPGFGPPVLNNYDDLI